MDQNTPELNDAGMILSETHKIIWGKYRSMKIIVNIDFKIIIKFLLLSEDRNFQEYLRLKFPDKTPLFSSLFSYSLQRRAILLLTKPIFLFQDIII